MKLLIIGHKYQYEMLKLTQIFYPNTKIDLLFSSADTGDDETVITTELTKDNITVSFAEQKKQKALTKPRPEKEDEERCMASMLFSLLCENTGYIPKWGMLTGIRPSKLFRGFADKYGEEKAKKIFTDDYFVSKQKTGLTASVASAEEKTIALSRPDSFSLYVAIPFCPSRCSYCSFVSHSTETESAKKTIPEYVKLLCEELRITGKIAKEAKLRLESVYFGGGTPTSLSASQLTMLFDAVRENFDLSTCREYTVEAGRPDTITEEKLLAIKNGGAGRISINPQTFSDEVLKNIGRRHSANLTREKFLEARSIGFDNINTDLIAGLPGDTYEGFCDSLTKTLELSPENITVHTLALKRASNLGTEIGKVNTENGAAAEKMLDFAYGLLTGNGYFPYYMYRQSKTLNNLENTGYAKKGRECLYNIFMMEECHSIFAVGAGAVTKICIPEKNEIKRIFNFKYPYEYISRFDIIKERKNEISALLTKSKE